MHKLDFYAYSICCFGDVQLFLWQFCNSLNAECLFAFMFILSGQQPTQEFKTFVEESSWHEAWTYLHRALNQISTVRWRFTLSPEAQFRPISKPGLDLIYPRSSLWMFCMTMGLTRPRWKCLRWLYLAPAPRLHPICICPLKLRANNKKRRNLKWRKTQIGASI